MNERKNASREEEFRDYEQRDIRDGWPYADDEDTRRAARNAPYGASDAGLDKADGDGIAVAGDPAARDVDGAPLPFADDGGEAVADDDLEARIAEALEEDGRVDLDSLSFTIRDGIAVLDGAVDSEDDRRHLVALFGRVKGVREVRAGGLLTRGVDSHIPRDSGE
ncbi:BON domain-containing protein [Shinella sp. BYT-45]|uniref:BON domain-containing protein n=1 Tax=Shinella sp. BYT-45 TaxID=3377377 RepID=UPI0039805302